MLNNGYHNNLSVLKDVLKELYEENTDSENSITTFEILVMFLLDNDYGKEVMMQEIVEELHSSKDKLNNMLSLLNNKSVYDEICSTVVF